MLSRLLCLLLFSPFTGFSQLDSLKGRVRSIKDTLIVDNKLEQGIVIHHREMDFGQYRLTDETIFDGFKKGMFPGSLSTTSFKEYDEKGKLLSYSRRYSKGGDAYTERYRYDEYGDLVQRTYEGGTTNMVYLPLGDSIDHIISSVTYGNDPESFWMKQYFYNRRSQLIEEHELTSFHHDTKINYRYDEEGRNISKIYSNIERGFDTNKEPRGQHLNDSTTIYYQEDFMYNPDGSLQERINGCNARVVSAACQRLKYRYDERGRKSLVQFYQADSLFSYREYEYNEDNTLKKLSWSYKDKLEYHNDAEYFYKNKELTKVIFHDMDKTIVIEFSYKTDKQGNWTEQTKTIDGRVNYVRKRDILYWE